MTADSTGRNWLQGKVREQGEVVADPNQVIVITDPSGSTASILPGFGFNCFSFQAQTSLGLIETLYAEPGFDSSSSPLASGIPVLFPFGGRLNGDSFTWDSTTYTVTDAPDIDGNILHGFVIIRSWRVLDPTSSKVTAEFKASVDYPQLLDQYPSDFAIRMSYEVSGSSLISEIEITNPSDVPMPYGFATHGYYAVPLGSTGGNQCQVTVPANKTWILDENVLPTGETVPVNESNDLRDGPAFGTLELDAIYTDVVPEKDGSLIASIYDPASMVTLRIISTGPFREFVVYTPAHRKAIAIEPYTCSPTTFDLTEQGFDAGLRVLDPGRTENLRIEIQVSEG